ncbi:MAG TPA: ATP-binding protein [Terriglobales bacterium]|nr:ATP-binding protein [Terriglobales bacterium]
MPIAIPLNGVLESGFTLFIAGVVLVERRGRHEPLDPKRQIEIRTLLDSMPESVVIVDIKGKIVDANATASRLSALSREQLLGMNVGEFARRLDGEAADRLVKFRKPIISRALAGEAVQGERREVRHPVSGEPISLLVSANPIRNEQGELQGALLIARDVTELTQLQQRLADTDRHQAIGHVAAGIAHDFNNTLQTISQAVAVLKMAPDKPATEQKVFLDMIENAVRRGAEVISRIRDYLLSGKSVPGEVDLRSLVEDAIELTRPMWQAAGVSIQRELKQLPKVRGNPADLRRVFTNLIINGVQAMPHGGTLLIGCEDSEKSVHVWVRDTGQGILPEIRKQVFNPYFTTKPGGTGLGLSGAQKILLELGGNISFQSEPGRGTQFDLQFPKREENQERKSA